MRGPRLPDVLRARGNAPLPRDRPRPRATWTLICLGLVVSASAAALLGLVGSAVWLLVALTGGTEGDAEDALWSAVSCAFTLAVSRRLTRGMLALWLAESEPGTAEP